MTTDELREKIKTISAAEVARKTLLNHQTIYNFRKGRRVSLRTLDTLEKYARLYIR